MTLSYARAETTVGCYRCGYPLVGIADDQPCPECGLLAVRSRRPTDELHFVRPRWLRRLKLGLWLIIAAFLWPWVWAFCGQVVSVIVVALAEGSTVLRHWMFEILPWLGSLGTAAFLFAGAKLLTTPEGYAAADEADRGRRRWLVISALVPIGMLIACFVIDRQAPRGRWQRDYTATDLSLYGNTIGVIPFTMLLFLQLRGLAKRARSAWLAEHCVIVGVGTCCTMLWLAGYYAYFVQSQTPYYGRRDWETGGSTDAWMLLTAFLSAFLILFYLWALMLMTRFAIAFRAAGRVLNETWVRDDRSIAGVPDVNQIADS